MYAWITYYFLALGVGRDGSVNIAALLVACSQILLTPIAKIRSPAKVYWLGFFWLVACSGP